MVLDQDNRAPDNLHPVSVAFDSLIFRFYKFEGALLTHCTPSIVTFNTRRS